MRREYPESPIVGVGAVIIHDDRVLLIQRGQEPLKGEWSLPGGALELGETLEQGIRREVLEETGLAIEPVKIIEVLDRIVRDDAGTVRFHYVLVDFVCRITGGALCCASDASAAHWLPRKELNSHSKYRAAPFTVAVIEKGFQSQP
ncbi:NUDIX hydrolase [Alloacidobacterium sp.]|uniref:NUDIX hydrolase n=1 Tax=Alloacidobacterium sp. TaxID=2951999 RepID=UPI002D711852|nr:NUDIX hydrolase [Alloacidobacterium sp.]HYK37389.1 NUDIX hydrolase [Alloacidobacterium sp.]